ncbi:MAG: alpha/beta hydrolase [Spirochaetes bacterium]|nr:alpha/beta hydrolase [Spirochaetota bacterium]
MTGDRDRTPARPVAVAPAASLVLALLLAFALCGCKNRLLFYPYGEIVATPADAGIEYEDVYFPAAVDGVRLNAWWVPLAGARGTVLFCHGNGGNISFLIDTIAIYRSMGLSVLAFDYRGYGRSEGSPTEEGTYRDALGAWEYLVGEKKADPARILLVGRSLGGAVAAWLAVNRRPGGLVLESTFTRAADVANHHYSLAPGMLIFGTTYDTISRLGTIASPILVIHSPGDEIIPFAMGEELFRLAPEPKEFLTIQGSHNGGFMLSRRQYRGGLDGFVTGYLR